MSVGRRVTIGAAAVFTAAAFARAEASTPDRALRCSPETPARRATTPWAAPLDRRVSLVLDGLPLREALTRLSQAADIRLTYIAELLPLDRRSCGSFSQLPAGDVLATLLEGTALAPVAAGAGQVVLAPVTADAQARARAAVRIGTLERVTVTGRRGDPTARPSALAVDVIDGRTLERRGATTLAGALNGLAPGLWIWTAPPGAATVRVGSLRGASSFGASAPKVYIDGIEVANPIVLTQLRPETVDRVEIIRGPQGGALFGADAIGGVIQITTRHDPALSTGTHSEVRTSAGVATTEQGERVATQDHAVQLRMGSATRSGGLAVATSGIGDYVPGGATRQWNAATDLRLVGTRRSLVASARYFSQEAGNPSLLALTPGGGVLAPATRDAAPGARGRTDSPDAIERLGPGSAMGIATRGTAAPTGTSQSLPTGSPPTTPAPGTPSVLGNANFAPQSTQQYTIGAALTDAGARWTTRVTLGADGYRLANPISELGRAASAADSALRAASGAADRLSARVLSSMNATVSENTNASLSIGGEHTTLRDATADRVAGTDVAAIRHSTGLLAKADLDWRHRLTLTAGARLEQNLGYTNLAQLSFLPTLGVATTRAVGPATLTLRSAWGRAIRPPRTPTLAMGVAANRALLAVGLEPEVQSGFETGLELGVGSRWSVQVTRFDQRAAGLIQASTVTAELAPWRQPGTRRLVTALQNVGVIANRGWELNGSAQLGPLALTGMLALVDSRVDQVARGYLGDLRAGDRMLDVPARTAGLTATWTAPAWSASLGTTYAGDWIGYDRAAIARDLAAGTRTADQLSGAMLRRYWLPYAGVQRLRAGLTRDLSPRFTFSLAGENLLDVRRGEPDNLTILPGRTIVAGIRAKF